MGATGEHGRQLLERAVAARVAGDTEAARAAYVQAYDEARAAADIDTMTQAALGLAAGQIFGTIPGRVPAFLHEAYTLAEGKQRAQLAVELTRAWVYGGDPERAVKFATEATAVAESFDDATLLAAALDAQLLVRWGPDDFDERLRITARLDDTVAHVADVEARLNAYIWRMTTALECLDMVMVRRQQRSLDLLAGESQSARVQFFAASRRGMQALLAGDLGAAAAALDESVSAGTDAGEADTYAIERVLTSGIARVGGDIDLLRREAAAYEEFATREGVLSVGAEATVLWLEAGELDRARSLVRQLVGDGCTAIPRDLDWLLTTTSIACSAARTGLHDLAAEAAQLLEPYAGRAVVNAGAVAFHGMVDDYLCQVDHALGHRESAQRWARSAAAAYDRIGAIWWRGRLDVPRQTGPTDGHTTVYLHPVSDGLWSIGESGRVTTLRDMKGFHYLRLLVRQPGVEMSTTDLSDAVAGHAGAGFVEADLGEVVDKQALAAYRRRLGDIDEDLNEAQNWEDEARASSLTAERDALLEQVSAAIGLAGRSRTTGGSAERARVAVRKAVAAAVERIEQGDPKLGRLLRDTVRTGSSCRYEPDPARPVQWILDQS